MQTIQFLDFETHRGKMLYSESVNTEFTEKRRKTRMKFPINKTKAAAIALFLVLTTAASCVALPLANAHTPF
jgi:hypothetical protein